MTILLAGLASLRHVKRGKVSLRISCESDVLNGFRGRGGCNMAWRCILCYSHATRKITPMMQVNAAEEELENDKINNVTITRDLENDGHIVTIVTCRSSANTNDTVPNFHVRTRRIRTETHHALSSCDHESNSHFTKSVTSVTCHISVNIIDKQSIFVSILRGQSSKILI